MQLADDDGAGVAATQIGLITFASRKQLKAVITSVVQRLSYGADKQWELVQALISLLQDRHGVVCYVGGQYYGFVHRTFLEPATLR
jgi:hypothetical protein